MARYMVVTEAPHCIRDDRPSDQRGGNKTGFRKYGKGQPDGAIFESDDPDLLERFPNKFKLITEQNEVIDVTPERRVSVAELIESGVWDAGARAFLETLPEEGYEQIKRQSLMVAATNAKTKAEAEVGSGGSNIPPSTFGTDITDRYQQAYDNGLKVYLASDGKCNVCKPGAKKALNRTPLGDADVEEFVSTYLADMARGKDKRS